MVKFCLFKIGCTNLVETMLGNVLFILSSRTEGLPNVLIEAGFLSNNNEAKLLGQSRYRNKISRAIFAALINFKDRYENPLINDN